MMAPLVELFSESRCKKWRAVIGANHTFNDAAEWKSQ